MLLSLSIKNYVLIDSLDLDFTSGFSVITGETGAGKSILLGAIGLLAGNRADSSAIRSGAAKCIIEGTFEISTLGLQPFFEENELEYDDTCILRRELLASGKSRAFINDTPVALAQLKALGVHLVDIHSQHQNLLLGNEGFQIGVLDILADDAAQLAAYRNAFQAYNEAEARLRQAEANQQRDAADEDYLRFQLQEMDHDWLVDGIEEELEEEQSLLSHAEEIKSGLYAVSSLLDSEESSLLSSLKGSLSTLNNLAANFPKACAWAERIENAYIDLKDLADDISESADNVSFNPQRLECVEERLSLIYKLEQKHHVQSVAALLTLAASLRERLSAIDGGDNLIEELRQQYEEARARLTSAAQVLSDSRHRIVAPAEKEMVDRLQGLGISGIQFKIEITPRHEPATDGMDDVTFLFSANKSTEMQDIASVASGGEISRVMLSLKALIASARQLPTILFDEIDTGVSGHIADRMANTMKEMADRGRQIISITHLPQIAAKGDTHYKVSKTETATGTLSTITPLCIDERVNEIAAMMSGSNLTDAAINNAKALLGI